MRHLKLTVAILSGFSLAAVCGLVVNVVSGNELASHAAFFGGGLLAAYSLKVDH